MVISYVMDDNASLPWVAWAIVFKLGLDLGGKNSFVAAMIGSNSNRISARGCIA